MKLDVNRLRRRPEGPRVLVALDQSTLSEFARNDAHAATRELLLAGVKAGKLVCPMSLGASDETLDAQRSWKDISDLHEELSMGIEFLDPKTIRQNEALAAAAAFCHEPPLDPVVNEAFETDPHTPRDELFPGGFRVAARFGPTDVRAGEVAREKNKEVTLQVAYDDVRARGLSFEQQADGEYEAMVRWVLGPLADPSIGAEFRRKYAALADDDDGAISKYLAVSQRVAFAKTLVEHFPAVAEHAQEFAASEELSHMPALRCPALLRAGLGVMPARVAQPGDGYDIDHLSCGLSRCDLVTADGGMTQLVRNHKLVPRGCQLFSTREMSEFHRAVDAALAGA